MEYQEPQPPSADRPGGLLDLTPLMTQPSETLLQIRASFFGLCVRSKSSDAWICKGDSSAFASEELPSDPLGILDLAERYRSQVLFSGLL